ncbi:MAG TPA: hypothetical protein VJ873_05640, partial [bacterium]|nr:hypothetical protein [bacterium]
MTNGGVPYDFPNAPGFMGSGGGGGAGPSGGAGGHGGGYLYIEALSAGHQVNLSSSVLLNGGNGLNASNAGNSGGGGGSGGALYVHAYNITGTGSLNANGGLGGHSQVVDGGGGGGGGLVNLCFTNSYSFTGSIAVGPGAGGTGAVNGIGGAPGQINYCNATSPNTPTSTPTYTPTSTPTSTTTDTPTSTPTNTPNCFTATPNYTQTITSFYVAAAVTYSGAYGPPNSNNYIFLGLFPSTGPGGSGPLSDEILSANGVATLYAPAAGSYNVLAIFNRAGFTVNQVAHVGDPATIYGALCGQTVGTAISANPTASVTLNFADSCLIAGSSGGLTYTGAYQNSINNCTRIVVQSFSDPGYTTQVDSNHFASNNTTYELVDFGTPAGTGLYLRAFVDLVGNDTIACGDPYIDLGEYNVSPTNTTNNINFNDANIWCTTTPTPAVTFTPTSTPTLTPTFTTTNTATSTCTNTPTYTPTFTTTYTATNTASYTPSYTTTSTPTFTPSSTTTNTCTATPTNSPTNTPTVTSTPTLPVCPVSPKLDLRVNEAVGPPSSNNVYDYQFQIYNNDTVSVVLSDLVVRLWLNDSGSMVPSIVNQGAIYDSTNTLLTNVLGTSSQAFALASPCTSPANRQANWEIRFLGTTGSQSIPPGGKWVDGKLQIKRSDSLNFDNPADDFSQVPAWQSGSCLAQNWPVTYGSDPYYALYYQGSKVQEWSDANHQDTLSGMEPSCIISCISPTPLPTVTCTSTPSNTPTSTPSGTPTATRTNTPTATISNTPTSTNTPAPCGSTPKLDLKAREITCSSNQLVWRFQIFNWSASTINLSDLEVRVWINDNPPSGFATNVFTSGAIYDGTNTFVGTVNGAGSTSFPVGPCTLPANRQANWQFSFTGPVGTTLAANGGRWVDGQLTINRTDFSNLSATTDDFSQIPAGQTGGCTDLTYSGTNIYPDDPHYALYYKGTLVSEWTSAGTQDPNTGTQPSCLPQGCVPPTATPTPTITNTPTYTPSFTPTLTPSFTPTNTATSTCTNTPTYTPSSTPTWTPSSTPTNTPTLTPSFTPTYTPTNTTTLTPTLTATNTETNTPTNTPTNTFTNTPTNTATNTLTNTPTLTPTFTPTFTSTNTTTNTPTNTTTNTPTASTTATPTSS